MPIINNENRNIFLNILSFMLFKITPPKNIPIKAEIQEAKEQPVPVDVTIIKEEILKETGRAYSLTYRDKGGESGIVDIYADSDDEAVEKAVDRVKRMGNKYNQKFMLSRLVSPDGQIVAS